MNADYAHLLDRPIAIDWALFARALRCEMRKRGMTQTQVEKEARLSRATVSRASTGMPISTASLFKLCIWADLNPFELLRAADRTPEEYIGEAGQMGCFT